MKKNAQSETTIKEKSLHSAKPEHAALHLSSRFTAAVDYARAIHVERRKGTGIPYMAHLLGVASLVMGEAGQPGVAVNEDMVIAAILHDVVEDHGGRVRLEDVRHNFGDEVARMVSGLSDTFSVDAHDKEPWPERKRAYVERLRREPADVQLISAADKLYNARTMLEDYRQVGAKIWARFHRGRNDQIGYFRALLDVFHAAGSNRIVAELTRVVDKLDRISADEA